jgi:2'-5' RNA ligase
VYNIGIGALIDDSTFTDIRAIELELATQTGNRSGLAQPPHVTIKSPFAVDSMAAIHRYRELMDSIAGKYPPIHLELSGAGTFLDTTVYLSVATNDALRQLHEELLALTLRHFPDARGAFEGSEIVFHSTIAKELTPTQFTTANHLLTSMAPKNLQFNTTISRLGLLLQVDNHWIVLAQKSLTAQ